MNEAELHPIIQTMLPVLKGMCQEPEGLVVFESPDPDKNYDRIIWIEPNIVDGKIIIGSTGRTINAIKRVFGRAFARQGQHVDTRVRDTYKGMERERHAPAYNPNFDRDTEFNNLLARVLDLMFESRPKVVREDYPDHIRVCIDAPGPDVDAIGDVFWPFGKNNGRVIKIRTIKTTKDERDTNSRTRAISGGK